MCIIYTINNNNWEVKCKNKVKCQRVIYMLFANEQYKAVLTYCTVELLHKIHPFVPKMLGLHVYTVLKSI